MIGMKRRSWSAYLLSSVATSDRLARLMHRRRRSSRCRLSDVRRNQTLIELGGETIEPARRIVLAGCLAVAASVSCRTDDPSTRRVLRPGTVSRLVPEDLIGDLGPAATAIHDYGAMWLVRFDGDLPEGLRHHAHVLPDADRLSVSGVGAGRAPGSIDLSDADGGRSRRRPGRSHGSRAGGPSSRPPVSRSWRRRTRTPWWSRSADQGLEAGPADRRPPRDFRIIRGVDAAAPRGAGPPVAGSGARRGDRVRPPSSCGFRLCRSPAFDQETKGALGGRRDGSMLDRPISDAPLTGSPRDRLCRTGLRHRTAQQSGRPIGSCRRRAVVGSRLQRHRCHRLPQRFGGRSGASRSRRGRDRDLRSDGLCRHRPRHPHRRVHRRPRRLQPRRPTLRAAAISPRVCRRRAEWPGGRKSSPTTSSKRVTTRSPP